MTHATASLAPRPPAISTQPTSSLLPALYLDGASRMAPWLVGVVPYGFIIGTVISNDSVSALSGWLGGPLIYGGSAHLSVLELLESGAHAIVILLTTVVVHARLVLYSAALAPHWQAMPWRFRALSAAMIADPSYAVATEIYEEHPGRSGHARYFGACAALTAGWLASITTGIAVGGNLPAGLHLEFAIPLCLMGHLMKMCTERPARRTATVAASVTVVLATAPLNLGLIVGILAAIAAGDALKKKKMP